MSTIRAPEFDPNAAWINTLTPLSIRALRGHVVVLHFWSMTSLASTQIVPSLNELARRHRNDALVVVGVHSGSLAAEQEAVRVEHAVRRLQIEYPVVIDRELDLAMRYTVKTRPSLVFVSPAGHITAVAPGEPDPHALEQYIQDLLQLARRRGELATRRYVIRRESFVFDGSLRYPTGIAVHRDGRIAVSDTGHHRVLVLSHDGRVLHAIGNGAPGRVDSAFSEARFDGPQGVTWDGEWLWICDANNHCVRVADVRKEMVWTFAGNGARGTDAPTHAVPLQSVALRAPWSVAVNGDAVWIAMADGHQIWLGSKRSGEGKPFAGLGTFGTTDGPLTRAMFAQPQAVLVAHRSVYVLDSAANTVRKLDLARRHVETIVGNDNVDDAQRTTRMQHPAAFALDAAGGVLIADTLNDSIRRWDALSDELHTLYKGEGVAALHEPRGIAIDPDGTVFVCDTLKHRVVRIDPALGFEGELVVQDAPECVPDPRDAPLEIQRQTRSTQMLLDPAVGTGLSAGNGVLTLTVRAPTGWSLASNTEAHLHTVVSRREDLLRLQPQRSVSDVHPEEDLVFTLRAHVHSLPDDELAAEVQLELDVVLERADRTERRLVHEAYTLPIQLARSAGRAMGYNLPIARPDEDYSPPT